MYYPCRQAAQVLIPRLSGKAARILDDVGTDLSTSRAYGCLKSLIREVKLARLLRTRMDLALSTTPDTTMADTLVDTLVAMQPTTGSISTAATTMVAWADSYFDGLPG